MIPRLPEIDAPATPYLAFLSALRAAGFEGDVTAAAHALPVKFHTYIDPDTASVAVEE